MNIETVKISELLENPNNTRIHTERQIKEFSKSIEKFGVVRPIVVDENNMILIGHGLKKALEALGRSEAEVMRVNNLSESDKKKLLLSDNKIYDLGVDDFDAIDKLIREMQDFDIPGYDPENLEMLYGASSLVESSAEFKQNEADVQKRIEKQNLVKQEEEIKVPASVETARAEAVSHPKTPAVITSESDKPFIICPHCGGKVYVS